MPSVRYYGRRGGFASYFTSEAAMMVFQQGAAEETASSGRAFALALTYLGANPETTIEGRGKLQGRYNYLVGADPAAWRRDVPAYSGVVYRDLWPGIDMTFREEAGRLKYTFVVRPGADPSQIRLAYGGADGLTLRDDGALLIETAMGALVDDHPASYQLIEGRKHWVETSFRLATTETAERAFGFALEGDYAPGRTLVIDPGLVYSTYLGGGTSDEEVSGIAIGGSGNVVVVGQTSSTSVPFPTTPGAFDASRKFLWIEPYDGSPRASPVFRFTLHLEA